MQEALRPTTGEARPIRTAEALRPDKVKRPKLARMQAREGNLVVVVAAAAAATTRTTRQTRGKVPLDRGRAVVVMATMTTTTTMVRTAGVEIKTRHSSGESQHWNSCGSLSPLTREVNREGSDDRVHSRSAG